MLERMFSTKADSMFVEVVERLRGMPNLGGMNDKDDSC